MHERINHGDLLEFENVFVYASDPFDEYMAANASYSNLCIEQKPDGEGNLKISSCHYNYVSTSLFDGKPLLDKHILRHNLIGTLYAISFSSSSPMLLFKFYDMPLYNHNTHFLI